MKKVMIPIYNIELHMFDNIAEQIANITDGLDVELNVPETATGYVARTEGGKNIIYIYAGSQSILAHESFHAAREVYNVLPDNPFATDSAEPFAYLLEWIFKKYCKYRGWSNDNA